MIRRLSSYAGIALAAALACGCGADPDRPPAIRYGEEACSRCRMIISDNRFAAALVTPQGDARKYDDIGCLVIEDARQPHPQARYWVRSFAHDLWLDARTARYRQTRDVQTPMGYGLLAQAEADPAQGTLLEFHQLARLLDAGTAAPDGALEPRP
jgi:copper chaperone NosL